MEIVDKISSEVKTIMACGKRIFARPWDEEDCNYFFQLIFDSIVRNSRSSEELKYIIGDFGMNVIMMLTHLDEKEGNSNDPF